ncbi:hypothetical protein AWL63_15040 [Sphingomonas panacis]|uniref:Uncharacterized protein n=2 Tax=Sphingomonas panacis TaxID=1560345 RepID=A0A1B3ZCD0_9SPHN|nr:hypothetical protein AWL63_15040 [Sphingomonas panacis]
MCGRCDGGRSDVVASIRGEGSASDVTGADRDGFHSGADPGAITGIGVVGDRLFPPSIFNSTGRTVGRNASAFLPTGSSSAADANAAMMAPFGAALLATMVPAAAIIAAVAAAVVPAITHIAAMLALTMIVAHVATAMIHAMLATRCVRSGVHLGRCGT